MTMTIHLRTFILGAMLAVLTACSQPADVNAPSVPMGNFKLGHNIVVVSGPEIGPFSRKADDETWKQAITDAVAQRFGGYTGDKFYHIGIKMDAYALAQPGVPVVFAPKSVLVITVNVWDDASGKKLNAEPKTFTVFEGTSAETIISSGLLRNKKKQMSVLSANAAKAVQDWILENRQWVGMPPLPKGDGAKGDGTKGNGADANATDTPNATSGTVPGN